MFPVFRFSAFRQESIQQNQVVEGEVGLVLGMKQVAGGIPHGRQFAPGQVAGVGSGFAGAINGWY